MDGLPRRKALPGRQRVVVDVLLVAFLEVDELVPLRRHEHQLRERERGRERETEREGGGSE